MNRRFVIILGIVGAIVAILVAWYLISPLFIDRTVDEELPFVSVAATEVVEDAAESVAQSSPLVADTTGRGVQDREETEVI